MIYALDDILPEIAEDSWVAPGANVLGRVTLATGASVWFGATLRGDNERITLGEGSNVQDGCTLHTDMGFPLTIGRDCTIGHGAILHGCTIGDESLIGMGAIVLNGARIGRNCLIGAGALVAEGKQIPEGSLVLGSPGRVVREMDAEARAKLRESALGYQANMRRFRKGLREHEGA
ncbi:gamma carbonic anhydrase family protein [Pararhodobacter sp. SW119]|uniref:gamma carbonic anhydrase family protein n=1 Tax=Pararhodobacter sp. SW119 TaxID=2780075 RepID=UPI001AE09D85|nr:gamma carbonic anhydrase family protein [Pararhodobacter sp. SW119]